MQFDLELSEYDNPTYSLKSDAFALAILGHKIKPTHKRTFEGLLSKIKLIDLDDFIKNDKPLRVNLSINEYKSMFPRDSKITNIFKEAALYYSKNSNLEVLEEGNFEGEPTYVNVIDTIRVLSDGSLEILFTRGIMSYLNEVKMRLLILDIREFSLLSSKYGQKMYEMFSSWRAKDIVSTRVEITDLRKILSVPNSYNNARFLKLIMDVAISEINKKTTISVSYTAAKGNVGKAYRYIDFVFHEDNKIIEDEYKEEIDPDIAINLYHHLGLTDEQFNTIVKLRKDKKKPVYQESLNEFFKIIESISKAPGTMSSKEIISIVIMQGYVSILKKEWFLSAEKSSSNPTTPKKSNTPKNKEKKPEGVLALTDMLKQARVK